MTLRILFAGTPAFAAAHLETLLGCEHELLAVYTQPDRPTGRGKRLAPSPVKVLAGQAGLAVEQPASLKTPDAQRQLASYKADVLVVVAYGLLLPKPVLEAPRFGCINVHASLLPRWRGAAPVERAIEHGDTESGVTIMQMDEGLDTGPMLKREAFALAPDETGDSLRARLCETGGPALLQVLAQIEHGSTAPQEQDDTQASYAHKLDKREAQLDFSEPAIKLARKIRAFTSALPCHGEFEGQRIKLADALAVPREKPAAPGEILEASKTQLLVACGEGALCVRSIQLPGGKPMGMAALLNGRPDLLRKGKRFD